MTHACTHATYLGRQLHEEDGRTADLGLDLAEAALQVRGVCHLANALATAALTGFDHEWVPHHVRGGLGFLGGAQVGLLEHLLGDA